MVVFDASFLLPLLSNKAHVSIAGAHGRVAYLYAQLSKTKEPIVVPTPALAEVLAKARAATAEYIRILTKTAAFRVVPFDTKAAIELSQQFELAAATGDKRGGVPAEVSRHKIKFDRQIISIARATESRVIYSDDPDFKKLVGGKGPEVIDFASLPEPAEDAQLDLGLGRAVPPDERAD
jgi:predicted nucleic acid-binding protein